MGTTGATLLSGGKDIQGEGGAGTGPTASGGQSVSTLATTTTTAATTDRPPTIKALHWKLLFGNHRSELGQGGWDRLAEATGAPHDVKDLPLAEDVPLEAFNQALGYLDETLGDGDGSHIHQIAVESVHRWATMYRTLVDELEGRPSRMLRVFCDEVHPWFVDREAAADLIELGDTWATVRIAGPLEAGFRAGLLEGFVELTGTQATVERLDGELFRVTWEEVGTHDRSLTRLLPQATRARFLGHTVLPILLGTVVAYWQGAFDLLRFAVATVAAVTLHLSANAFNDVADHLKGIDPANLTPTPFSGGSRTIQLGLLGWRDMVVLAGTLGLVGIGLGLWLVTLAGWPVLALGLAGVGLGYAYSGRPFELANRGLGELAAALVFGPLITAGAFAVQTGAISTEVLAIGLPIGVLMAAQLYLNEMPDAPWDARVGKRTLVVRLGEKAPWGLGVLLAGAYLSLIGLVVAGWLPLPALLGLATVPMAIWTQARVHAGWQDPEDLVTVQKVTLLMHAVTGALITGGVLLEVLA